MIITVTLNPSIDRTMHVTELARGEVNRAVLERIDAGGKGVNVSRALVSYGAYTHAIFVAGELGGTWLEDVLDEVNVPNTLVVADGVTRMNITMVHEDGAVTKINEQGISLTEPVLAKVEATMRSLDLDGTWVVLAGRLNPGASDDTYVRLGKFAREHGAKVAVDVSGEPMRTALAAGGVSLIKPNQHELGDLVGRELGTVGAAVEAAQEMVSRGVEKVVCSLGADGALYVDANQVVHAEPGVRVHGTPVGAGDTLLGIFLAAGANAAALPTAIQWSAASVTMPGTAMPTAQQAAAIPVIVHSDIDLARKLHEDA